MNASISWARIAGFVFLQSIALIWSGFAFAANNEKVAAFLEPLVQSEKFQDLTGVDDKTAEKLRAYYQSRSFKPVWGRDTGIKGKGKALFAEIQTSRVHGFDPAWYSVDELKDLVVSKDHSQLARMDLLMTGAAIEFGHDLVNGRFSGKRAIDANRVAPVAVDPVKLIKGVADSGNLRKYIATLVKPDARYIRMIAKLAEFDRIRSRGLWPKDVVQGAEIKPGRKDKRLEPIARMLALTGDLPFSAIGDAERYGTAMQEAVKSLQKRYGLPVNGRLDEKVFALLRISPQQRLDKIKINLERRRWQNRDETGKALYLNLADGGAKLTMDGKTKLAFAAKLSTEAQNLATQYATLEGFAVDGKQGKLNISAAEGTVDLPIRFVNAEGAKAFSAAIGSAEGRKVPIFITYITAWATRNGTINFRPDILRRDAALKEILNQSN